MLTDKEFEERLILNQEYLLSYAKALCRNCKDYEPEDLWQDTNLRAWDKRDYFREDTSLSGWLCFMMHNLFVNHVVKRKLKYHRDTDSTITPMVERYSDSSSINHGEGNMVLTLIEDALLQLPTKDRDIVQRFISGESQASIGESYNMKDNAVKQRYFWAIREVREALRKHDIDYDPYITEGTKRIQSLYRSKQASMEHNIRKKLDKLNGRVD